MANRTERADLLNEIELMKLISQGNHLHIVNMIGCVTIQEPIQLCMTIVKHGDLLKFLQYIRQNQLVSISISTLQYLKFTLLYCCYDYRLT